MGTVVGAYMQDNDTLAEQAQTLGFFTTIGGDPLLARTYPEVVRQVSRNDMMEAAQKYLTPDAIKVIVLAP
jgi:predicted Zn-dependent peptidase